jgi:glutamate 5-kinase
MGLAARPNEIPKRQAVAAIGQAGLIREYEKAFSRYNKNVAQILLTSDGLTIRKRYLNARNTLRTLLEWKVIPIINENDTVSVEEIKFGDNDNLAAMIALLMNVDILVNLTNIAGLFNKDPRMHTDAEFILTVSRIEKSIEKFASHIPGTLGTGGMFSKITAAKKVTAAGIPMVIANGEEPNILLKLFAGKKYGTFFLPKKYRLPSRKCWIGFTTKPKGSVRIDDGAATAILKNGKSLLPSGIVGVEGNFDIGAPVEFKTAENKILGIGLVNYDATDIRKIMGLKSHLIVDRLGYKPYDEVIHRDNLVITDDG